MEVCSFKKKNPTLIKINYNKIISRHFKRYFAAFRNLFQCIHFLGLLKEVLQTGWLKTIEVYSLVVLELGVQNQVVGRAMLPLKPIRENLLFLPSF